MPAIAHAYRRGANYSWCRRIPRALAPFCQARHLVVCLGTHDPHRARFLAGQLSARSDLLFRRAMHEPEPDLTMTRRQLDGVFRDALLAHLAKLDRVAAAERAEPGFAPDDSRRADRRMDWVFRLLAGQGAAAAIDEAVAGRMTADGLGPRDVAEAAETLAAYLRQAGPLMPPPRLEALLERQAAAPTAVNLALAQETAFRAMAAASFATERRYDGLHEDDDARLRAIMRAEAEAAGRPVAEGPARPEAAGSAEGRPPAFPPAARPAMDDAGEPEAPARLEAGVTGPLPRAVAPSPPERHPIAVFGEALIAERARDGSWDEKTTRQARQLYGLFAKLLTEKGLVETGDLRQVHVAAMVSLLRAVSPSYGKSPRDAVRTTAELRAIGAALPPGERGLSSATVNRHLTFLGQLLAHLRAQGCPVDGGIDVSLLRSRIRGRARHQRAALTEPEVEAVFRLPCFTGCRSWREPFAPGPELFHRALYFAVLLLYYTGARREEICGLELDDVAAADSIPHLDIRPNATRRLKNDQSARKIALHGEVIRLGFLDYVGELCQLGHTLVFPELRTAGRAPLGDKLYDEFVEGLRAAVPGASARTKVLHSFRHAFGDSLKRGGVHAEIRADLLGHGGTGETEERYCDATTLAIMRTTLERLPTATAHLERRALKLLPLVADAAGATARRRWRAGDGPAKG